MKIVFTMKINGSFDWIFQNYGENALYIVCDGNVLEFVETCARAAILTFTEQTAPHLWHKQESIYLQWRETAEFEEMVKYFS